MIHGIDETHVMSVEKTIDNLKKWVEDDRRLRDYATYSDFDKYCEEKCLWIEALIKHAEEVKSRAEIVAKINEGYKQEQHDYNLGFINGLRFCIEGVGE